MHYKLHGPALSSHAAQLLSSLQISFVVDVPPDRVALKISRMKFLASVENGFKINTPLDLLRHSNCVLNEKTSHAILLRKKA